MFFGLSVQLASPPEPQREVGTGPEDRLREHTAAAPQLIQQQLTHGDFHPAAISTGIRVSVTTGGLNPLLSHPKVGSDLEVARKPSVQG